MKSRYKSLFHSAFERHLTLHPAHTLRSIVTLRNNRHRGHDYTYGTAPRDRCATVCTQHLLPYLIVSVLTVVLPCFFVGSLNMAAQFFSVIHTPAVW